MLETERRRKNGDGERKCWLCFLGFVLGLKRARGKAEQDKDKVQVRQVEEPQEETSPKGAAKHKTEHMFSSW